LLQISNVNARADVHPDAVSNPLKNGHSFMPTSTKSTIPTPESITVTITRTVQVKQYEPVGVTISETYPVPHDEDMDRLRRVLTKRIGRSVEEALDREVDRYSPTKNETDDE